jgi:plasmid replication initiation protein
MSATPQRSESTSSREHYRDELNFAEFPLASVSTKIPKGQKTLEFNDEIFDKARNERVSRKLTITASDKYGLPTAIDDEVILGLIQLTGKADFADRKVFFTRYELLKLLGWTDATRYYDRLEESLNRWLGVTLFYEKAWWSKEEQSWVNEGFHILDHVQILDKERQSRRSKKGEQAGKSSFVWNEVVFNSFKAGYLKQIDFEFYKRLESAISKRMYRFLDKRFYHRQRLEFDLRTFACEHIGLSKNYHNGELKRVLAAAIAELEEQGFLKKLPSEERFVRQARKGEWGIAFVRESKQVARQVEQEPELVKALIARGVNASSARALVAEKDEAKIREKIALFDWLSAKKDSRIQRSPAGFLYRSIADDFSLPDDYVAAARVPKPPPQARKIVPLERHTPMAKAASDREVIDQFWNAIPREEQERIEQELVVKAPKFLREQYMAGRKERGVLFQAVRQAIIDEYARGTRQVSKMRLGNT